MNQRARDLLKVLVRELARADGHPMEVAVLQVKVENFFNPRPTLTELEAVLRFAEEAALVRGRTTETNVQIWAITEKGRLAEL